MHIGGKFVLALTVCGLLSGPALAGGPEPLAAKEAAKEFKKASASHLKFFKAQLKLINKDFCVVVDSLVLAAITSSIAPDLLLLQVQTALATTLGQVDGLLVQVMGSTQTDAESFLGQTTGHPANFIAGDCSELDKAREGVIKELIKLRDKLKKKLKSVAKALGKGDYEMTSIVQTFPVVGLAPNPDEVGGPTGVFDPLQVVDALGMSLAGEAEDGTLCLGGTADPDNGQLDLDFDGPDGFSGVELNVTITPDGRWSVCVGDGTLPEGNYRVTLTQGGQSISFDIGIAGWVQQV